MRRFLLIGHPVGHSLSPAMHNAAFRRLGVEATYAALDVDDPAALSGIIDQLRQGQYAGANVTIPHKVAVLDLMDEVTPRARRMGAVNTIMAGPDGRLTGDNTDGYGLLTAIGEVTDRPVERAVVFGAGGAARACLVALADAGATSVSLVARNQERAEAMLDAVDLPAATRVALVPWPTPGRPLPVLSEAAQADLLLNTTPVSLGETGASILSPAQIATLQRTNPRCLFADLVYRPAITPFLRPWAEAGGTVATGLAVLLYQGAESFRLWLGGEAPVAAMAEAIGHASTHPLARSIGGA